MFHDFQIAYQFAVERRILNLFQGGCQLPLGSYCEKVDGRLHVWTAMADAWDMPVRTDFSVGIDAEELAQRVVFGICNANEPLNMRLRDLPLHSPFRLALEEAGWTVFAESLIDIVPLKFEVKGGALDWVCFSSSHGADLFSQLSWPARFQDRSGWGCYR